jgi:hypothetical protein
MSTGKAQRFIPGLDIYSLFKDSSGDIWVVHPMVFNEIIIILVVLIQILMDSYI